MRRYLKIRVLLSLLLYHGASQAQIKVGIQAGIGRSWLYGTSYINFKDAGSYTVGLSTLIPLKNNFSIVSGLQYQVLKASRSQLSFTKSGQLTYGNDPVFTHTEYITLPISGRYTFKIKKKPSLYLEGGGYLSYLMSFKNSGKTSYDYPSKDIEYYEDLDKYKRLTLGVSGGGGFLIRTHIEIGLKYNIAFTSLNDENINFKNLQFLMSYYF